MNDRDALQALLDGKKITSIDWIKGCYIFLSEEGNIMDEEGDVSTAEGLFDWPAAGEWEIYKESKIIVTQEALDEVWKNVRLLFKAHNSGFLLSNAPASLATINNGLLSILEKP